MHAGSDPEIVIDLDLCDREGLCVLVCPWVFEQAQPEDFPVVKDPGACFYCGHCVAVCPSGAITHHSLDMENFPEAGRHKHLQPTELVELLRSRRSHRRYNPRRPVKRSIIERMLEAARYSPTGSNVQTLQHVVVTDPETLVALYQLCIHKMRSQYALLQDGAALTPMRPQEIHDLASWEDTFESVLEANDAGRDELFYGAPGVIITHAPREGTPCPVEDATLAAFHMMLMAESLGLGTCFIGNFYELMRDSQAARDILGIPAKNDILMCFTFGYPAVRFRRLVDRQAPRISWI
jgi:nitroreductase/NAD-dependent dihydropyrimidine dehydrogenase PreA subunit